MSILKLLSKNSPRSLHEKNLKESKIHGPNIHKFNKNFMRKNG